MCGGQIAYLALIEPTMAPPTLEVRQKIVDVFEMVGPYFNAFAAAVLGDSAQINQPILEGLTLLARPRFPMRFFSSVRAAAEWLCGAVARVATGPLTSCNLVAAAAHLQQLEPDRQDGRRRARSMPIARA